MSKTIGSWTLGKARLEISAHEPGAPDYRLTLTLPDTSVVVSGISQEELIALAGVSVAVQQKEPLERWDGQSGG